MPAFASRAGHWPLALTFALVAACSDDPAGPARSLPSGAELTVADPWTVTNTNDSGIGSLRWVLSYITGGETVRFDPSIAGQTIVLDSTIALYKSVTIEGPAGEGMTISGGGKIRPFEVWGAITNAVTFRNLSLTGGRADSTTKWSRSGGVTNGSGHVVFENSAIFGNHGAQVAALIAGHITLVNTTMSGNTVDSLTGPMMSASKIEIINSTIANNTGSGIGSGTGFLFRNSILANNTGRNCFSGPISLMLEGANISDDDTCGGPTVITIADPQLQPLADNGGPTPTHAVVAGSPAINLNAAPCSVATDQRYAARDASCDAGAFEFADFTTVTVTVDAGAPVSQSNGWATVTGTVTCSRNETFSLAVELHQSQKVGRAVKDVHAAATVPVECSTTARPWTASMVTTDGSFQNGTAMVTAATFD
ncbi:MAG: polymorphic outer membrane protein, partial [Geminicoccaceae bacterium]|nr:polymorphic outer membrane protein [Geminicoccaceae bacterium]